MDSIKDRFFALDDRITALEETVGNLQKPSDEIHLVSYDREQGEIPLNEFDTFRFVKGTKWPMTEYTKLNGRWINGIVSTSNIYFLLNPTIEIKEQIELITGHSVNFSKYTICFKYSGKMEDFESAIYKNEIQDFYLFWYQGGPCYGRLKLLQNLKNSLQKKNFEIESFHVDNPTKHIPYDVFLKEYSDGMKFSATLTVVFKNKYSLVPHISYFISPIQKNNIQVSLKSLILTQAVFEFKYGKEDIPTTTVFHWMLQGMLQEEKEISNIIDDIINEVNETQNEEE